MNLAVPAPPKEQPDKAALALSALVHLLLVGALFFGVQWKSQAPTAVQVEIWRAAPAPAPVLQAEPAPAPKPEVKPVPKPEPKPEPKVEPPKPVKPDIAIKDKKPEPKKEEPKKPEPKKEEPKKEEPKEPKKIEVPKRVEPDFSKQLANEQKQLDQQKAIQDERARASAEANLRAQLKSEQADSARQRGLENYIGKLRAAIKSHIVLPPAIQGNPEAIFAVTQLPDGSVIEVKLRKSSGNKLLDEAIERAILKSSPLPKPDQPGLFQRELQLKYKPLDE